MDYKLSPQILQAIDDEVRSGRYANASEVIEAAIENLIGERLEESPEYIAKLKAAVQVGLDELDRGECDDWDPEATKAEALRLIEQSKKKVG